MSMDNGMDCEPSWKELKAERDEAFSKGRQAFNDLLRVEKERDTLAAYAEEGKRIVDGWGKGEFGDVAAAIQLDQWARAKPASCLARRDAEQQASAINKWSKTIIQMAEWAAKKHNEDPSFPPINLQLFRELCCDMDDDADRIRRQAEEAPDAQ